MKELVEILVGALVDHRERVSVSEVQSDRNTVYEVRVHPDDVGKVIGRQGRIIKAVRTVVKSASGGRGRWVTVEVLS